MLPNIIITVVSFLVFIISTLKLVFKRFLVTNYEYGFYNDEVLKVEKANESTNYLFVGPEGTREYINEYVIGETKKKKKFICEYGKSVNSIEYYILAYNGNQKLINIIRVKERRPNGFSKAIKIPKKTKCLNFVIHKVNGFNVDLHPVQRVKVSKIFKYSFWMSVGTFSLLNAIRLLIIITKGQYFIEPFLKQYGTISYIALGALSGVLFFTLFFILLGKNRYFTRNRGGFYGKY